MRQNHYPKSQISGLNLIFKIECNKNLKCRLRNTTQKQSFETRRNIIKKKKSSFANRSFYKHSYFGASITQISHLDIQVFSYSLTLIVSEPHQQYFYLNTF